MSRSHRVFFRLFEEKMGAMADVRNYYRQIAGWLPCGGTCKKKIMERIRVNVEGYLSESPDADLEEIQKRFGEPREIAAAYVSDMDTGELLRALRVRRRVLAVALTVVMFVAVSWGGYIAWSVYEAHKTFGGHTETVVIDGEWQDGMTIDWVSE